MSIILFKAWDVSLPLAYVLENSEPLYCMMKKRERDL